MTALLLFAVVLSAHDQALSANDNHQRIPSIKLHNAADTELRMPVIGLGTGGYASAKSPQATPEYWNASAGFENSFKWFNVGGRRWDSASSYESRFGVAEALLNITDHWSTIKRDEIFLTSKIGPPGDHNLGYNDALSQLNDFMIMFDTDHVDLLLMHWPSWNTSDSYNSSDPFCNAQPSNKQYDATKCRQSTWRAMETAYQRGQARAIGVSNFEQQHLEDIFALKGELPAVNQFEFHGYWHEFQLVEFCQSHKITVNSYAPLGTPDVTNGYWDPLLPEHPVAIQIGKLYGKSAAQVWLRWQYQQGIVTNPRSWNIDHQRENLDILDFELNEAEMLELSSLDRPAGKIPKVCPDPNEWA